MRNPNFFLFLNQKLNPHCLLASSSNNEYPLPLLLLQPFSLSLSLSVSVFMEDQLHILQSLSNGDTFTQIQAAYQIANFTRKQRLHLSHIHAALLVPLISMLRSPDFDAIQAALLALLSLAFGSERNKTRIVEFGGVEPLVSLLQCERKELIELTMAALLTLSSCSATKRSISSSGCIDLLINFLNDEEANHNNRARLDAIVILHNLSTCRETIPAMVSSGVVFTLISQIQVAEKASELAEKSIALLSDIASRSETALSEMGEREGSIQAFVGAMEEGSSQCREDAVKMLLSICKSCREKYRAVILDEGGMAGVLQLSVEGTRRGKQMAKELLLLLREGRRGGRREMGLAEQVMREIDEGGERVEGTTLRMVEEMIAKLTA